VYYFHSLIDFPLRGPEYRVLIGFFPCLVTLIRCKACEAPETLIRLMIACIRNQGKTMLFSDIYLTHVLLA